MINKDELIFTVDENNQPIAPIPRKQAHSNGIWHRTNDIVLVNSKNEILVNKRSMLKDTGPGKWDASFGGHVLAGQDDLTSALQELREESGLQPQAKELQFIGIAKHQSGNNNEFRYLYLYHWEGSPSELQLEKEEIDEAKWLPFEIVKANKDNQSEWSPMPYFELLAKNLE